MGRQLKYPLLNFLENAFLRVMEKVVWDGKGCCVWTGARMGRDMKHGHISYGVGKTKAVHIVVYEYIYGPVPKGKILDHKCDNGLCVWPYHIRPVTHKVNILRGISPSAINARKDCCIYGHELTPENLYIRPTQRGRGECKICLKARNYRRHH